MGSFSSCIVNRGSKSTAETVQQSRIIATSYRSEYEMALQLSRLRAEIKLLRQRFQAFLWLQNMAALSLWKRTVVRSLQILVAVFRDLLQEQISLRAMSLVFTTLIGIFPLFALTFAVLKGLGVHNAMEPTLLTLLQPLGERASEVTQQILT